MRRYEDHRSRNVCASDGEMTAFAFVSSAIVLTTTGFTATVSVRWADLRGAIVREECNRKIKQSFDVCLFARRPIQREMPCDDCATV